MPNHKDVELWLCRLTPERQDAQNLPRELTLVKPTGIVHVGRYCMILSDLQHVSTTTSFSYNHRQHVTSFPFTADKTATRHPSPAPTMPLDYLNPFYPKHIVRACSSSHLHFHVPPLPLAMHRLRLREHTQVPLPIRSEPKRRMPASRSRSSPAAPCKRPTANLRWLRYIHARSIHCGSSLPGHRRQRRQRDHERSMRVFSAAGVSV